MDTGNSVFRYFLRLHASADERSADYDGTAPGRLLLAEWCVLRWVYRSRLRWWQSWWWLYNLRYVARGWYFVCGQRSILLHDHYDYHKYDYHNGGTYYHNDHHNEHDYRYDDHNP